MYWKNNCFLAYATNLNPRLMARLCPTAVPLGTFVLPDYELVFRTTANAEKKKGASLPCVIWELGIDDELALDTYERWPDFYIKERFTAELNGEHFWVLGYILFAGGRNKKPPTDAYLQKIVEGYEYFGFDTAPLYLAAGRTVKEE